ncbi:MAG: hypothetical protein V2A79_19840 [Planctomycetota bacterium]
MTEPTTADTVAQASGLRLLQVTEQAVQLSTGPRTFRVRVMRAGNSLNGYTYPPDVIRDAAPLFDGATAFLDHASGEDFWRGSRSVRDVAGAYANAVWSEPDQAIEADLTLIDDHAAALLGAFVTTRAEGRPVPNIGISADLTAQVKEKIVNRILIVHSADIVFGPAAGGAIHHALNAALSLYPDLFRRKKETEMSQDPTSDTSASSDPTAACLPPPAAVPDPQVEALRLSLAQDVLRARLDTNSDLPPAARDQIRTQFAGRTYQPAELDQALANMRTLVGQLSNPVRGHGAAAVITMDPLQRIQLAADYLLRVPGADGSKAPRLRGIRELYTTLTGDHNLIGRFNPDGIQADLRETTSMVMTTTFTSVCKNALNKVLLAAYDTRYKWWQPIAHEEDFESLNGITWIKTSSILTLPTVAEQQAYTELTGVDIEETSTFLKKGGYVGLTLEAIDRDDVNALRRIPVEMGMAASRALSALVSALFTDNTGTGPAMVDTYNVFDATYHANLATTALSWTTWNTAIQAMWNQTDASATYKIGVRPRYCLVPIELETTALQIFKSAGTPGTADNDVNPLFNTATVIPVPNWTNTNNWAAVADPNDCPCVCIGYRFGRAPEMFVADQPEIGALFTNDEIRFKARFFVAVGVADHRGLYKSNVA